MELYQILCLCGVPSISALVIGYLIARVHSYKALEDGMRSQLKHSLLSSYSHCKRQGYKTLVDAEVWNDMYNSYTALKGNGLMRDDIKPKFDALDLGED